MCARSAGRDRDRHVVFWTISMSQKHRWCAYLKDVDLRGKVLEEDSSKGFVRLCLG